MTQEALHDLTILDHDQEFFRMYWSGELLDLTDLTAPLPPSLEYDAPAWAPYLTDGDMRDYGHYLCWIKKQGSARKTADNYRQGLHRWREALDYEITIDKINAVLRQQRSAGRHTAMIAALKSYAKYRHALGDSRLYAMIVLSHTLLKPTQRYAKVS